MSRIQNKALKLHSSSIRPRAVKVQSPPYPITGSEELIEAAWGMPEVLLETISVSVFRSEPVLFAVVPSVNIGLTSIITEYTPKGETWEPALAVAVGIDLSSTVLEHMLGDTTNYDLLADVSINLEQVVIPYEPPAETLTFNIDSFVEIVLT